MQCTSEQARVTADVAGLEKRADKTDDSIQELKMELVGAVKEMRTELVGTVKELKTEVKSEMQGMKTELKSDMREIKNEMQEMKTELRSDVREIKSDNKDVKERMQRIEIIIGAVVAAASIWQYINTNAESIGKWLGK